MRHGHSTKVADASAAAVQSTTNPDGGGWRFDGDIDDIRIYARALSAAEVTAMYDREQPESQKKKDENVAGKNAGTAGNSSAAGVSTASNGTASSASSGSAAGGGAVATADPPNAEEIGVATNLGTGQRKTGGKLIWIPVQNLPDNGAQENYQPISCTAEILKQ